jgi:hypothetical protein
MQRMVSIRAMATQGNRALLKGQSIETQIQSFITVLLHLEIK